MSRQKPATMFQSLNTIFYANYYALFSIDGFQTICYGGLHYCHFCGGAGHPEIVSIIA